MGDSDAGATRGPAVADSAERQPTGSAPAEGRALSDRDLFRIQCVKDARYHEDRERFFARLHRGSMFVVVLAGTASLAWLASNTLFALIVTIAGLLDLVFDVSGRARLHASIRRRMFDILAQSEDESRPLSSLKEQAVRVYADEPPCMHAVNAIAYNGAMDSFGRPHKYQFKVEWYHRWFRHVWSFTSTEFKTFEELDLDHG